MPVPENVLAAFEASDLTKDDQMDVEDFKCVLKTMDSDHWNDERLAALITEDLAPAGQSVDYKKLLDTIFASQDDNADVDGGNKDAPPAGKDDALADAQEDVHVHLAGEFDVHVDHKGEPLGLLLSVDADGLLIEGVFDGCLRAQGVGLCRGDFILAMNGIRVAQLAEYHKLRAASDSLVLCCRRPTPDSGVPKDVVDSVMSSFQECYNEDNMAGCSALYADECLVTVNGGVDQGGPFTGTKPEEVAAFFGNLRNAMGGTNIKFSIESVEGLVHTDSWVADNGTGTCKATWAYIGDKWKMTSDEITFVPNAASDDAKSE